MSAHVVGKLAAILESKLVQENISFESFADFLIKSYHKPASNPISRDKIIEINKSINTFCREEYTNVIGYTATEIVSNNEENVIYVTLYYFALNSIMLREYSERIIAGIKNHIMTNFKLSNKVEFYFQPIVSTTL